MLPALDLLFGKLTNVSLFASDTDTQAGTASVTVPATVRTGDLLVVSVHGFTNGGACAAETISGFTQILTQSAGSTRTDTHLYKMATAADAGSTLSADNGVTTNWIILAVFRGNEPIRSVTPTDTGSEGTNGDPTAQTVTASGGTPPLIVFGGYSSSAAVDPRTFSTTADGDIDSGTNHHYLDYKIYNAGSSPSNASIDMDDEGVDNILTSYYLVLTE